MTQIFQPRLFALVLVSTLVVAVSAKILHTDIPISASVRGTFPNAIASTQKVSPAKEKRERFLGDGTFTLGYSTRFNYGGFGGSVYPGLGYYGGHGHHGFYPSHGLEYGQYYDPYFSRPYHHHHHHGGGYSGGFGFKHHFHQQSGFHSHFNGYPGFY